MKHTQFPSEIKMGLVPFCDATHVLYRYTLALKHLLVDAWRKHMDVLEVSWTNNGAVQWIITLKVEAFTIYFEFSVNPVPLLPVLNRFECNNTFFMPMHFIRSQKSLCGKEAPMFYKK